MISLNVLSPISVIALFVPVGVPMYFAFTSLSVFFVATVVVATVFVVVVLTVVCLSSSSSPSTG